MDFRFLHPPKANISIAQTLSDMEIDDIPLPEKADPPITSTPLGIVIDVNSWQKLKAKDSIRLTLEGIVTDVRCEY